MKPQLEIALALIWRGGEVLVSRRLAGAAHLPNFWEFPGGKIESGETPQMAAIREAREEIGLEVEIITGCGTFEWEYDERRVTLYPFHCRIAGGELAAREVAEIHFVAPSKLKIEDFPPANAALIQEITAKAPGRKDF